MENTCIGKDCPVYKRLKCKNLEECINYIETWFVPVNDKGVEGKPILVKDCINKRMMLMMQDLTNNMNGLHKSQDDLRNQAQGINNMAAAMINTAVKNLDVPKDEKILIGDN